MPSRRETRRVSLTALAKADVPSMHAEQQMSLLFAEEMRGPALHGLLGFPRIIVGDALAKVRNV